MLYLLDLAAYCTVCENGSGEPNYFTDCAATPVPQSADRQSVLLMYSAPLPIGQGHLPAMTGNHNKEATRVDGQ